MIAKVYLIDYNAKFSDGTFFPIVLDDSQKTFPEKLQVVRQTEFPVSQKFYKLVNGVTIDDCPLYHETYKED